MVHISEIAYSYVNDISEYLSEGQTVQVKVIGIDANNRINLSIKQTAPPPPKPERRPGPRPAHGARERRGPIRDPAAGLRCSTPNPSPRAQPALRTSLSSLWRLLTASCLSFI